MAAVCTGILTRAISLAALAALLLSLSRTASAQVTPTPAAPSKPPGDAPSVRVGGVIWPDFIVNLDPKITDATGNEVSQSAFGVGRAYINVTGQLNHLIKFRLTPDITRETGTGSSLNGSLVFRLKYGYAEFNLDDWMWRGTYVRVGMIQTPIVGFEEDLYRYRFQGTVFPDREGYLSSADFGVMFRTQFPNSYGEVVGAVYNGDAYTRADPNNQKAIQVRGTLRPFPAPGPWRGLRLTGFYDFDNLATDLERRRAIGMVTFEHPLVNAAFSYLDAKDQAAPTTTTPITPEIDSSGYSFWMTPRTKMGLEGLLRIDRLSPNEANDSLKQRVIAGIAYWPRMPTAAVQSAILLDYEQGNYEKYATSRPTEKRLAVHMLISF